MPNQTLEVLINLFARKIIESPVLGIKLIEKILLDFAIDVLEPVNNFQENIERIKEKYYPPPKSKFMEEGEKMFCGIEPPTMNDLYTFILLVDKYKVDKHLSGCVESKLDKGDK